MPLPMSYLRSDCRYSFFYYVRFNQYWLQTACSSGTENKYTRRATHVHTKKQRLNTHVSNFACRDKNATPYYPAATLYDPSQEGPKLIPFSTSLFVDQIQGRVSVIDPASFFNP